MDRVPSLVSAKLSGYELGFSCLSPRYDAPSRYARSVFGSFVAVGHLSVSLQALSRRGLVSGQGNDCFVLDTAGTVASSAIIFEVNSIQLSVFTERMTHCSNSADQIFASDTDSLRFRFLPCCIDLTLTNQRGLLSCA